MAIDYTNVLASFTYFSGAMSETPVQTNTHLLGRTPGFTIGDVDLKCRVIPAPMCNISDRAYRGLTRRMGADLVTTQMVSAEGLIRDDANTWRLLDLDKEEKPVTVQLLGSNPKSLARAAQILEEAGATIVDLNMGCPARHVTGNECGSALMRDAKAVEEIVRSISSAISIPFTVKMRAGWGSKEISALDIARICEDAGAKAIALHARTREQGYRGKADWTLITAMKEAVSIPVIGNGDVLSPADAVRMFRETGCDAVMLGRGIIGNPWLLRACQEAVTMLFNGEVSHEDEVPGDELVQVEDNGEYIPIKVPYYMKDVGIDERLDLILEHTQLTIEIKGEKRAILEMRKHSQQYIKGIPGCKSLRTALMKVDTMQEIGNLLDEYRVYLSDRKVV